MKASYILHFNVPFQTLSEHLPEDLSYRLAMAAGAQHYTFDAAVLTVQRLNLRPFYVELFELRTQAPFAFNLELTAPQHFLFLMLHGQAQFTTAEGFYLSHAPESHLSACCKAAGHYRLNFGPGRHVACCVALEPTWLEYTTAKLPLFRKLQESSSSFLPYVRMDPFLHRRLEEILTLRQNGHGKLDGFLRLKFAEILEYYSPRAEKKQQGLVYRVREHLDTIFLAHGLTSRGVAKHFETEERTLRNRFRAEFNLTLRNYFTALRLRYATDLMRSKKLPVRDVYYLAGYNDESTFRYELRKYGLSNQRATQRLP